jgi:hypothetical protein
MLCAVVAGATARLDATVLVPVSLGELANEAGAIVRGRVVAAEARFTPDRRAIETLVTLDTEEALKGSLGPSVHFLVPGGTLGRYRSIFVGAPAFALGQRVVVFLGWNGPSYPYLLGLSQGVFRLQADGANGWLITPTPIASPAATARVVRGDPARRPMPLAEFEQQVRALVAAAR